MEAEQSRKGSRWDKPVSSGHILKSGITLAVWCCSQNTLSSLQHLIKSLLIFSWWSQPSQHLAASSPLFLQRCQETHKLASNTQTCQPGYLSPMNRGKKSFLQMSCTQPEEGGIKSEGKFKEILFQWKDLSHQPFVARVGKNRQSSADLWKKCTPSSLQWAPADSSSAQQKTERRTALLPWLQNEPKPGSPAKAWAIDHVKKTGQLTDRRGSRQGAEGGRQARCGQKRGEESSRQTLRLWSSGCFSSSQTSSHHL